ncbi:hypothetical protein CYLTODRAFT_199101 [Cylindrobasidium torrendii FP15055 ss-10]|uniref:Uncharacterized protein n=1 Tax=Cylindrobasidium torrendii FP15055 ss-10 TaxID=1314674 RepID=A0A0D7AUD3_9AGAR|nr:hypothetical protein CYLTODRAFT_199101 [Cylindrobasidium torrendii FP15055 ss-10]
MSSSQHFISLSLPLPIMSTPDPGPPNTTMEAPVQQQDSLRDIPAILKKLKHVREALEALEADDSARPQPASGARNGTADKPRSPSQAAHLEPDDPMRDTIIPPKVFGMSRFKDGGGQHRGSERPQYQARKGASLSCRIVLQS